MKPIGHSNIMKLKQPGKVLMKSAKHKALEKALTIKSNKRTPYSSAAKADMEEARKYPRLHK